MVRNFIILLLIGNSFILNALNFDPKEYLVSEKSTKGCFPLAEGKKTAPMMISSDDYPGVIRAFKDLQDDIRKVTGNLPSMYQDRWPSSKFIIIAGTIDKNPIIRKLSEEKKIIIDDIRGRWESFLIQTVQNPYPGIKQALVIAGSDKRGTIYGIYELSEQIGVSPWYWWADVPVQHKPNIYIRPIRYKEGEPSVKYRGIFLNDEFPALTNWVREKFGTVELRNDPPVPAGVANYGHEFYSRIFELLLRLKGNYLWPAMWNNAFNEDDPENPKLADEYGIVMGTTHQEPMLRAQKEWDRRYLRTLGRWNYTKHPDILEEFWREGIRRNKNYESIITIGLRGADDTEMMPGGPSVNIPFLEKIISRQRQIISEEMNKDVTKVPQLWCLYKEVQEYYEMGLRVPDDVTLLWSDDNWGNLRRLPTPEERKRSGGAGIYYHFDYHGGPRSYQWINTNPIPKIWDQMSLAKQYGADRIWIVNVGHFKGYEFPIDFFLRMAWNTDDFNGENLRSYTEWWCRKQFGSPHDKDIAELIVLYTKYNGRRKPELLSPETYSLVNYHEAERVVTEYRIIAEKAEQIFHQLPDAKKDAFYQLVMFPIQACCLVNELYVAAAKNQLYAKQGRTSANDWMLETYRLFEADTALMGYFNRNLAGGKWNHFMDQAHLGYTNWADPPFNSLRHITLHNIQPADTSSMGVSIEESEKVWPEDTSEAVLPLFDSYNRKKHSIDIFNRGKTPFVYSTSISDPWIVLSDSGTIVEKDKRIWVSIDWDKVPAGDITGSVSITGPHQTIKILVPVRNKTLSTCTSNCFVEGGGYISIEAEHYTQKTDFKERHWDRIEDYGHTLSGMRATADTDLPPVVNMEDSPCLRYAIYLFTTGEVKVTCVFSPSLNVFPGAGIHYAISIDNEPPMVQTLVPEKYNAVNGNRDWEKSVMNNARRITTNHIIKEPGYHILTIWMVDPGIVLEKILIDTGGLKPSYLGPPESYRFITQ